MRMGEVYKWRVRNNKVRGRHNLLKGTISKFSVKPKGIKSRRPSSTSLEHTALSTGKLVS